MDPSVSNKRLYIVLRHLLYPLLTCKCIVIYNLPGDSEYNVMLSLSDSFICVFLENIS